MSRQTMLTTKTEEVKEIVKERKGSVEQLISSLGSNRYLDGSKKYLETRDLDEPDNDDLEELSNTNFLDEPEKDDILDILDSEDPDLTKVINAYWSDIQKEVSDAPVMKLYVATMYKLAKEYTRMENQITSMMEEIEGLGTSPALTNERARLRDNITSVTMEGYKLLTAVLESLHKIQLMINKLKDQGDDKGDIFAAFNSGDI